MLQIFYHSFSMLPSAGEVTWQTRTSGGWTNCSRRLVQCSGRDWTLWRWWWRGAYGVSCRASWTMPAILSTTSCQNRGAAAADGSSRCAIELSGTEHPLSPQPSDCTAYIPSGEGRGLFVTLSLYPSLPPNPPPHTLENVQLHYIYLFISTSGSFFICNFNYVQYYSLFIGFYWLLLFVHLVDCRLVSVDFLSKWIPEFPPGNE